MPILGVIAVAAGLGFVAYSLFSPYRVVIGFSKGVPYPLTVRKVGKLQNGDDAWLMPAAADAFEQMRDAAAAEGVTLYIASAFRSWDEQAVLKVKNIINGPQTAAPGYSNHQQGTTVDLDVGGWSGRVYLWLTQNAQRFGFRRTVASEPWHWEFVSANA